ncbi:MAG: hypothetical protein M4579_005165 [Chaenotheca gracillima]|nr:MAG: hypothetical protein M4579_005165 [Chaenotheca gracillima]
MTASEMLALYQNSSSAENMATPESSAPSSSATVGNTHPHKKNNTPIFSHSGEAAALRPDSTYSKATALLDSWADEDEKKQDQLTQWVETGNKLYKAWSTEDKLIWDKDRADDVTRAEIREKLKHGYVLILQKTPPAECGIKASRCAHKHCSAPNKRTPLGAFRLSLEPETNVHLEKVPTQALPKKTGQGTHGVTWYCLKCVEALWNKEQSEKRPKIILKIAKEKMTGPVDPDTADQAEKMQIDTAEEMVRPKIKGTENRQPEVKGKGKRRRMEEVPVEIDETKKDKGSKVVATVDEAAPRGLRVLVAASQRRANSEGSTETASQVDKTMQAAADDQTGSPGQTGAATRSPEAQRKRQQKKNQQRKARARQQTEDSELSLNTEDSHDYHHGEPKKPSTPSKQPGRAEKTYGREDLEDRKPISTPRKPDLTPFQRLYSNIIPEERNHASEYYYLSPPQLAALWKWKDVIKRREVFENPQNEAFLRRNGLLMGYDPELYLDDGEMLGAMEIGGLIIALTDAEVRDRDLSVVMGLVDTRAQVELDKEGWVPQPAPKKARKISLVLRVSMGANTPSPSAAVPAGSSGDEDTSGSDDEEDLGEARALY